MRSHPASFPCAPLPFLPSRSWCVGCSVASWTSRYPPRLRHSPRLCTRRVWAMDGWHADGRGVAATDACCHAAQPPPRCALPALLPHTRTRGAQAAPSTAGSRWPTARQTPRATLSCSLPRGTVWRGLPRRGGRRGASCSQTRARGNRGRPPLPRMGMVAV